MQISDVFLRQHLDKLEQANIPPGDGGFYRVALGDGLTLEDHPGVDYIELFGKLKVRVFPLGTPNSVKDAWFYGAQKEPPPQVCPKCGREVRHPEIRMTSAGSIELCDQCGTALGDPEPIASSFLNAVSPLGRLHSERPAANV